MFLKEEILLTLIFTYYCKKQVLTLQTTMPLKFGFLQAFVNLNSPTGFSVTNVLLQDLVWRVTYTNYSTTAYFADCLKLADEPKHYFSKICKWV